MIHPRKNFCTKCSLQFGNNHVYTLHLELLHKNEIEKTMIKSEDLEINTELFKDPDLQHQILSMKSQNEKSQRNEKNSFQRDISLTFLSQEQVEKASFKNDYTNKFQKLLLVSLK